MNSHYPAIPQQLMNINQLFHRDQKVFQGMPYFLDAFLYTKARSQGKICVGQEDIKEHIEAGKYLPTYNKSFDIFVLLRGFFVFTSFIFL